MKGTGLYKYWLVLLDRLIDHSNKVSGGKNSFPLLFLWDYLSLFCQSSSNMAGKYLTLPPFLSPSLLLRLCSHGYIIDVKGLANVYRLESALFSFPTFYFEKLQTQKSWKNCSLLTFCISFLLLSADTLAFVPESFAS